MCCVSFRVVEVNTSTHGTTQTIGEAGVCLDKEASDMIVAPTDFRASSVVIHQHHICAANVPKLSNNNSISYLTGGFRSHFGSSGCWP